MKKSKIITLVAFGLILISLFAYKILNTSEEEQEEKVANEPTIEYNKLNGIIMTKDESTFTILDNNNAIYILDIPTNIEINNEGSVSIKYNGTLDKTKLNQNIEIIDCINTSTNEEYPEAWNDNGIFNKFYKLAYADLQKMTLDEKIAQLLLVSHPLSNDVQILKEYQFAGFVFFGADFRNKNKEEVIKMIQNLQDVAKIPLLTAVDEEGGTVVRVSSNQALAPEKFKSPRELYAAGGLPLIKEDTIKKNNILRGLGLNLNLAPVVDVTNNPDSFMYDRSLGQSTAITSEFAKLIIETSKNSSVSYTLKHFPGYGSNADTHSSSNTDTRSWNDIETNDLPPFKAGIDAGAEAVMVSHNIINSLDASNPASLSPSIHNVLRNNLNYTGIIMTDDISMGATSSIPDAALKAILAGNELIITNDYEESFNSIKTAVDNHVLNEEVINKLAFRVIAWKYYKGLMYNNTK